MAVISFPRALKNKKIMKGESRGRNKVVLLRGNVLPFLGRSGHVTRIMKPTSHGAFEKKKTPRNLRYF